MNANSTRMVGVGAALALAGLLWGSPVAAQNMPAPQVSSETCAEVEWAPQMLAQYPQISTACQEVVSVNGTNWARIEGRLIKVEPNGAVTSMVLDRNGKGLGRITLKPAPDQKVLLEGKEYSFYQLQNGAILNMYVPEHMYAVATEPSAPSEMAEIEPQPGPAVAQQELPKTAGPLPWVLLAGGGILLLGLGLTLGRRISG